MNKDVKLSRHERFMLWIDKHDYIFFLIIPLGLSGAFLMKATWIDPNLRFALLVILLAILTGYTVLSVSYNTYLQKRKQK